jgi:Outer membrane protein beta-barrel domain
MENLDDMFKQSLAQDDPAARFDFREEYWQQAVQLLEADERRRKRRMIFWWASAAVGVVLLAALYFYPAQPADTASPVAQSASESLMAGPQQPAVLSPDSQAAEPFYENNNTYSTNPLTTQPVITRIYENDTPKSFPTLDSKLNHALSSRAIAAPEHEQSHQSIETNLNSVRIDEIQASLNNIPNETIPTTTIQENTVITTTDNAEENNLLPTLLSPEHQVAAIPMEQRLHTALVSMLPVVLTPVVISPSNLDVNTSIPPSTTRVGRPIPNPQWGLVTGLASPVNVAAEEHWSMSAGGSFKYRLSERWGVRADLNWRQRSFDYYTASLNGYAVDQNSPSTAVVDIDNIVLAGDSTAAVNYGFGAVSTVYLRNLSRFHLLELPFAVTYHHKRLGIELGVTGSMIAAVTGKYNVDISTQTGSNLYDRQTQNVTKSSFLPNGTELNRFSWGLLAGCNYAFNRHWELGTRLHWLPNRGTLNQNERFNLNNTLTPNNSIRSLRGELRLTYFF